MSFAIRDRLAGRRVQIVYEAAATAIPHQASRRERCRQVRHHLAENRAHTALVAPGSDQDTWWAAEATGSSLAAGIEDWISAVEAGDGTTNEDSPAAVPFPDECQVVIPLTDRVYLAEVHHGIVQGERFLPPAAAEEVLREAQAANQALYCLASNDEPHVEWIRRYVEPKPPPFDRTAWRFRPVGWVCARHGYWHPRQAVAGGLVLAGLLGLALLTVDPARLQDRLAESRIGQWVGGWIARWFPPDPVSVPPTLVPPRVAHSADDDLRQLARSLVLAKSLTGDGLQRLEWRDGAWTVFGRSERGWPARARQVATDLAAAGVAWTIGADGWTLSGPLVPPTKQTVPTLTTEPAMRWLMDDSGPVRFHLAEGPEDWPGRFDSVTNTQERNVQRTVWTARVDQATVGSLWDQAEQFEQRGPLPAHLTQADCPFVTGQGPACTLTLELLTPSTPERHDE